MFFHMGTQRFQPKGRGFTLVEVVITVAVLFLLIAITTLGVRSTFTDNITAELATAYWARAEHGIKVLKEESGLPLDDLEKGLKRYPHITMLDILVGGAPVTEPKYQRIWERTGLVPLSDMVTIISPPDSTSSGDYLLNGAPIDGYFRGGKFFFGIELPQLAAEEIIEKHTASFDLTTSTELAKLYWFGVSGPEAPVDLNYFPLRYAQ